MDFAAVALILIIGVIGFVVIGIYLNIRFSNLKETQKLSGDLLEYLKTTNVRLDLQSKQFSESIRDSSNNFNLRLDNAAKVIGEVQRNLGEMSEIGRGIKELQQFLASPKLRGNIGEQVLKDLIGQMFPKSTFSLQYTFKSGEKVDAAIKTSAGILPIDSKFPMENFAKLASAVKATEREAYTKLFRKDIKKHIGDISRKYILPEEGTMDFALMYIPSEAVYYEMVNDVGLMSDAQLARVYPVSPTTLYAHLQTLLLSFEGQKIENKAREVFAMLRAIQKDYYKVDENLFTLQKHVNNAHAMMGNVLTGYAQLGQKISNTKELSVDDDKNKLLEQKKP
ncbi:DNA recombination protein RmuC [Candidatus Woesebacteria bacterium]|nr:MAG: DNA recombination protein RmuC [Candidatus Woesebacteria bacterium]